MWDNNEIIAFSQALNTPFIDTTKGKTNPEELRELLSSCVRILISDEEEKVLKWEDYISYLDMVYILIKKYGTDISWKIVNNKENRRQLKNLTFESFASEFPDLIEIYDTTLEQEMFMKKICNLGLIFWFNYDFLKNNEVITTNTMLLGVEFSIWKKGTIIKELLLLPFLSESEVKKFNYPEIDKSLIMESLAKTI